MNAKSTLRNINPNPCHSEAAAMATLSRFGMTTLLGSFNRITTKTPKPVILSGVAAAQTVTEEQRITTFYAAAYGPSF
jgi:hypothetical protein